VAAPRGATLTTSVTSTVTTKTASVLLETLDSLSDPCSFLQSTLAAQILLEMGAPTGSSLSCSVDSISILDDARRQYRWTVSTSWTE